MADNKKEPDELCPDEAFRIGRCRVFIKTRRPLKKTTLLLKKSTHVLKKSTHVF